MIPCRFLSAKYSVTNYNTQPFHILQFTARCHRRGSYREMYSSHRRTVPANYCRVKFCLNSLKRRMRISTLTRRWRWSTNDFYAKWSKTCARSRISMLMTGAIIYIQTIGARCISAKWLLWKTIIWYRLRQPDKLLLSHWNSSCTFLCFYTYWKASQACVKLRRAQISILRF